jgi:hypothetical protein
MRRVAILLGSGLLLTPVAGFFGSALVFSFLATLLPGIPFINQLFFIGFIVGGIFGSMLAAPVTLAALPFAGWFARSRNWKSLLLLLSVGAAGGFLSPLAFYPTSDGDGTWQIGLWLLGALSGLVTAVPFYFLTTRRLSG